MDFSAVESAAGVVRVLTHKDVPGRNTYATFNPEQPVFCDTEVNFLGDMLALVVADTEAHARAAAKLARVEYEPLPGVFEIEDSYALGGPKKRRGCKRSKAITILNGRSTPTSSRNAPSANTMRAPVWCASPPVRSRRLKFRTCSRRSWICPPSASA